MPLADAQAAFTHGSHQLRTLDADPDRDRRALAALTLWAHRFAPIVSTDEPDGMLLDVSGCGTVFGGEDRLLAQLRTGLSALGFTSSAAIAGTFTCARAVARSAPGACTIVPRGGERHALYPLPVAALGVDASVIAGLEEVGIRTIAQLAAVPRGSLPVRFGEDLLLRLDRALGSAMEVISPLRPAPIVRAERVFDGPTTNPEAVALITRELVGSIARQLRTLESGVRTLDVSLTRADLPPAQLSIGLTIPTRDERHLWSLLRPRLESVHMGYGVERITLTAAWIARLAHEQAEHWSDAPGGPPASSAELVDTLVNRLGASRVVRMRAISSHIPERAQLLKPCTTQTTASPARTAEPGAPRAADRPTVLLDPPVPADAVILEPDGPVISLRFAGEQLRITACRGPERIGEEWWRGPAPTSGSSREYFGVQDEQGRVLWIYRQMPAGRWYVQGVWA